MGGYHSTATSTLHRPFPFYLFSRHVERSLILRAQAWCLTAHEQTLKENHQISESEWLHEVPII